MFLEIPEFKPDLEKLLEIIRYYDKHSWKQDGDTLFFGVLIDSKLFPYCYEMASNFTIRIKPRLFGLGAYSKMEPHIDPFRRAAINIPVEGDFANSPIQFWKDQNVVETHFCTLGTPMLIDTDSVHSVENNSSKKRFMVTLTIPSPLDFEQVKKLYQNNLLFTEYKKGAKDNYNSIGVDRIKKNTMPQTSEEKLQIEKLQEIRPFVAHKSWVKQITQGIQYETLWCFEFEDTFEIGTLDKLKEMLENV